ncbi:hypothetical protein AWB78_07810 [Caballeronia calidae]|uniref:Uncharacterized protein n=1 Tax=Caballeronia calidae TaxID=1777139 RepID=A0A158EHU9_9BURK|nr:hypothetical protein [Caballeronia calidae]SAL05986.1 hypothetical protein AWB78_07810 [Caballeronia calidae]
MMVTLDLSSKMMPLVLVNGEPLKGVTRCELVTTPDDTPVVMLRLVHFKVIGATLPVLHSPAKRSSDSVGTAW